MSYYDELGVSPAASDEEIRAAFRRKAMRAHPDKGGDADRMARVNKAYETLKDPQRRLTYDLTGEDSQPPIDKAAQTLILGFVMQAIEASDSGDPIATARGKVAQQKAKATQQIGLGTQQQNRLKKRLKKLKFKGKGHDFVRMAVEHQIHVIGQQIEQLKDRQVMLDRATELLTAYEFEADPVNQYTQVNTIFYQAGPPFWR